MLLQLLLVPRLLRKSICRYIHCALTLTVRKKSHNRICPQIRQLHHRWPSYILCLVTKLDYRPLYHPFQLQPYWSTTSSTIRISFRVVRPPTSPHTPFNIPDVWCQSKYMNAVYLSVGFFGRPSGGRSCPGSTWERKIVINLRSSTRWVKISCWRVSTFTLIIPPNEGRSRTAMIFKRVGGNIGATHSVRLRGLLDGWHKAEGGRDDMVVNVIMLQYRLLK